MSHARFLSAFLFALFAVASAATPARAQQVGGDPATDPYRRWAISIWGASVVNDPAQEAAVWGERANPDGDSLTNVEEYAYGSDPRTFNPAPVAQDWGKTVAPGFLALTYLQRTDDPALVVFPQSSSDLKTWWPLPPTDSFSWMGDGLFFAPLPATAFAPLVVPMQSVTQVSTTPLAGNPTLFTRMVVMRNHTLAVGTALDGLRFFESVTASADNDVDSNSVVLTGFVGSISLSVTGGAHLIVDGVDKGASASVAAGSSVRLRVPKVPGTTPAAGSANFTLSVANTSLAPVTWKVTTSPVAALSGVAGTVSGYTPVSASAGEGGAASVSIPITVPPGTGGMEPKLAIGYSSQGGNGLLGVGFGLSGLSAVSRVAPTIYHDGIKGGVSFGANDRFALDGQRLILVSGTEGAAGAEYRTENDSFSRVVANGATNAGPQSWTVQTKAGLRYEFGATADSAIRANRSSVAGDTAVLTWALTRITDNVGNAVEFTYALDAATGEAGHARVSQIDYTRNTAAGLLPNEHVVFVYENRSDVRTSYVAGAKVVVTKRLTAIECQQVGNVSRRYELAYQQATISGSSQLISVTEKGKKPTSSGDTWQMFPATVFTWQQGASANMTLGTSTQIPALGQMGYGGANSSFVQGDFKGDGHMGLMKFDSGGSANFWLAFGKSDGTLDFKSVPAGFQSADAVDTSTARLMSGDFNGDGKTDVLHISRSGTNNWLALSNGDGSFTVLRGSQLGALQNLTQTGDYNTELLTMDLNGDGRTDLVYLESHGNNRVFLVTSSNSFVEKAIPAGDPFRGFKISNNNSRYTWVLPGDYNGDGLGDILLLYYAGHHVLALSNGDGTFTVRSTDDQDPSKRLGGIDGKTFPKSYAYVVSGDFNGDGLTDVFCDDTNQAAWQAVCKGDGTFDAVTTLSGFSNLPTADPQYTHLYSGDINGDGFSDVFGAYFDYPNYTWLVYSTGNAAYSAFLGTAMGALNGEIFYDPEHVPESRVFVGDFDGDGRDDVLDLNYSKQNYLCRSNGFSADRVVQVTNGHGGYTKFNYKPLTDSTVYTKGNGASYPFYDMVGAMYVVSSVTTRNGVDGDAFTVPATAPTPGESTTTYTYERGWSVLDGRGMRGFAAMQSFNADTQITSRTEYVVPDLSQGLTPANDILVNLSGRPAREVQTVNVNGTNHTISETTTTWTLNATARLAGRQTFFPYATLTTSKQYEINALPNAPPVKTTIVSGVSYDGYGNLKHSLTDHGGGFTEETTSAFDNDDTPAHWWLGRLRDTVVLQTSPGGATASRHSTFEYSPANGQLTKETIVTPPTESNLRLEKTYQHDAFGNIWQSVAKDLNTGETRTTTTGYTPDGRFIAWTQNDLGHTETKIYDGRDGTVTSQTGPNGLTTTWTYDGFGRPLTETRPDRTQTVTSYLRCTPGTGGAPPRAVHRVTSQSSGGAPATVYFDVLDRQIRKDATGFDGRTVSVHGEFDVKGQNIRSSLPFFSSNTVLTAPAGQYTLNSYDPIGRMTQIGRAHV